MSQDTCSVYPEWKQRWWEWNLVAWYGRLVVQSALMVWRVRVCWRSEVIVRTDARQATLEEATGYIFTNNGSAVLRDSKDSVKGQSASDVPSSTTQKRIVIVADTRNRSAGI